MRRTPRSLLRSITGARTFSALRIPAYRYLWSSSLASTTSIMMQMFARGLLAYQLGGTASAISIISLSWAFPQLLFSLIGGTVADRFERRKLIMATQAGHSIIACTLSFLVQTGHINLTWLFMSGIVQGAVVSFSQPARQAFVSEVVGEKEFMNAIALTNAVQNLCRIAAPSLAGALVAVSWIDIGGIYFISAFLNIISFTFFMMMPRVIKGGITAADRAQVAAGEAVTSPSARRRGRGPMYKDLSAGIRYILHSPVLITLLALGLVPTFVGLSYQAFLPIWAKNVFGDGISRNAGHLGLLSTMAGLGALFGSLSVATLSDYRRRTLLQLGAGLGFGLFLTAFALQGNFAIAMVMLVGVGFMAAFYQSLNTTMIMSSSEPAFYGRVMSVNMTTTALAPIGTFSMGFIIDAIGKVHTGPINLLGVQAAYVGAGLVITAFILAVTVFNPSYRRLEQDDLRESARQAAESVAVPSVPETAGVR